MKIHQIRLRELLTETTSFTFRFEETKDISFTDGSFDVTDDVAVLVLSFTDHFNTDLGYTTTRTGTAKTFSNTSVFNLFFIL